MFSTASDVLISLSDFGQKVTHTKNGVNTVITAIFDNEYDAVDVGGGVPFAMSQPRLTFRTADLPNLENGDQVTIGGVDYHVVIIMPDGTGVTLVDLEKQ